MGCNTWALPWPSPVQATPITTKRPKNKPWHRTLARLGPSKAFENQYFMNQANSRAGRSIARRDLGEGIERVLRRWPIARVAQSLRRSNSIRPRSSVALSPPRTSRFQTVPPVCPKLGCRIACPICRIACPICRIACPICRIACPICRSIVIEGNFKADHVRQKDVVSEIWMMDGSGMTPNRESYSKFLANAIEIKTVG